MKRFTVFETAIMGFFAGVIVGAFIVFQFGADAVLGDVLRYISLLPLLPILGFSLDSENLIPLFVFTILIYTMYGAILGVFAQRSIKTAVTTFLLLFVAVSGVYMDESGLLVRYGFSNANAKVGHTANIANDSLLASAITNDIVGDTATTSAVITATSSEILAATSSALRGDVGTSSLTSAISSTTPSSASTTTTTDRSKSVGDDAKAKAEIPQYFGKEARGDINADGIDDIAFLLPRIEEDGTSMYYVSASLGTKGGGYKGTNVIFLGSRVEPGYMYIEKGVIVIEYTDRAQKKGNQKVAYIRVVIDGNATLKFSE